jgi:KUP system potassium uptake protein
VSHSAPAGFFSGVIKSLGLVFGDIGTSPIYTLTIIFGVIAPTLDNIFGILSLIVWTLILLVSVEYAWLAMSLGRRGEGGTIVLKEILVRMLRFGRGTTLVTLLSYLGVSLLLGDGVITPAISILSAVEGLTLMEGLEGLSQNFLLAVAMSIAVLLFIFQSRGTDTVARAFGPIMVVWFGVLALTGALAIAEKPMVLMAINPYYAVDFLLHNGLPGFLILSEVILCATGGEALYADMGHLGRRPIINAWYFVFAALVINYLGQGAFLLTHPTGENLLFSMAKRQAPALYAPFLLLTVTATVIASQALISGVFSIIYQALTTRMMPLLRVDYTSFRLKSQIYIPASNWLLLILVMGVMVIFRESSKLAAAYGLAVTGTMTITGIMLVMIYSRTAKRWLVPVAVLVTLVDVAFFIATLSKIRHGGYWSLILASGPLLIILIWTSGNRQLGRALRSLDLETFLFSYNQIFAKGRTIPGSALFFTRDTREIPPYIVHCMIRSNIIYEKNIFVTVTRTDEPFGFDSSRTEEVAPGLDFLEIKAGYREMLDIESHLNRLGIREKVIFYGIEDIKTPHPLWKAYALMRKVTSNFVQFYKLPPSKLQGVVTRVEM